MEELAHNMRHAEKQSQCNSWTITKNDTSTITDRHLPALKEQSGQSGKGISEPHDNDVLFGRGGNINVHPGNEAFRYVLLYKHYL